MRLRCAEVVGSLPLLVLFCFPHPARATSGPPARVAKPATPTTPEPIRLRSAIAIAQNWLAAHQDEDGKWDADGFGKHDPEDDRSRGPGRPEYDVGVTGLALLAFLGDGGASQRDDYGATIERALAWLCGQQDEESGRLGPAVSHAYLYNHGIATLALCEALRLRPGAHVEKAAQRAVDYVLRARNPYAAWRYDCPPVGDNDSSVTSWMVAALTVASASSLEVESTAFDGARSWFDFVTDPDTGRVGYDSTGSPSSRVPGVNERYPVDRTEAMTAAGLLSRLLMGAKPGEDQVLTKHADLLLRALPEWSSGGLTNDLYYWHFGTFAMYRMGGKHWDAWAKAMKAVLLARQEGGGSERGSWDPDGPWGYAGGRVYATALGTMLVQVLARSSRLYDAR